jgi:hypothetical protein
VNASKEDLVYDIILSSPGAKRKATLFCENRKSSAVPSKSRHDTQCKSNNPDSDHAR